MVGAAAGGEAAHGVAERQEQLFAHAWTPSLRTCTQRAAACSPLLGLHSQPLIVQTRQRRLLWYGTH